MLDDFRRLSDNAGSSWAGTRPTASEARRPWWRRWLGTAALAAMLVRSLTHAQERETRIYGWGNQSCGYFIDVRRAGPGQQSLLEQWVVGYLTGYNMHAGRGGNVFGEFDPSAIMALIERQCFEDPRQLVAFALARVIQQEESR